VAERIPSVVLFTKWKIVCVSDKALEIDRPARPTKKHQTKTKKYEFAQTGHNNNACTISGPFTRFFVVNTGNSYIF
jgi:hypothetical protein